MRYRDRHHAGELLAGAVAALEPVDPVVYALPRGGVPVAFEVAAALGCPLDVLVVRKVGVPFQPELAMGAIAEGGIVIRNSDVIAHAFIEEDEFAAVVEEESRELTRRIEMYRGDLPAISPSGHTAIVVDDGLATGSTALAAVSVLGRRGAAAVWLAVPVAPRETLPALQRATERVIALQQPRQFGAVGVWYRDFTQTSDDEVRDLLVRSRLA
ncbi:MAG TPA: phosphoribosyltransferase family protein [Acidimicrobiia bacterium]|nr:phosphoribosyltransferase family protein [Acidimicrobiia bacterium]